MEENKKEKQVYYGILMNKKNMNEGTYAYVPECFMKGTIEKDDDWIYFKDELENEYLTMSNPALAYSETEKVIGCIISHDELIKTYSYLSFDEAKIVYFNENIDYNYFGILDLKENIINVLKLKLTDLADQMFYGEEAESPEIDFELDIECVENNETNTSYYPVPEESDQKIEKSIKDQILEKMDIKKIKEFFDKKIIGQEEAKKRVISTIFMNLLASDQINKKSCLLVGPTGSGKTLIATTLGEYLSLPVVNIDTTQLTAPGYVGAKVEDYLIKLIDSSKGDLELARHGIVILDEVDKKGTEKNSDVSGRAVLNNLLPFVEGTTYKIKYNNACIEFDTSNLTIFATGAFANVANSKSSNDMYKNTNIGFNKNQKSEILDEDIKYGDLEIHDFIKYGNMPGEFMGRFTSIVQLSGHTIKTLKSILTESSISPLLTEKESLERINVDLSWTEGYIDAVVKSAIKLKTGARSLKNIIENSLEKARWEVLNDNNYSAIILTEKTIADNNEYTLLDKNGNSRDITSVKKLLKNKD